MNALFSLVVPQGKRSFWKSAAQQKVFSELYSRYSLAIRVCSTGDKIVHWVNVAGLLSRSGVDNKLWKLGCRGHSQWRERAE